MPTGKHLTTCFKCGRRFICGDCIEYECKQCQCKRLDHLWIGSGFCARCGITDNPIENQNKEDLEMEWF